MRLKVHVTSIAQDFTALTKIYGLLGAHMNKLIIKISTFSSQKKKKNMTGFGLAALLMSLLLMRQGI